MVLGGDSAVDLGVAKSDILLDVDGKDAFKFTFTTSNGKLSGRVDIAVPANAPDRRTPAEKLEVAKRKIRTLAAEFLVAAEEN